MGSHPSVEIVARASHRQTIAAPLGLALGIMALVVGHVGVIAAAGGLVLLAAVWLPAGRVHTLGVTLLLASGAYLAGRIHVIMNLSGESLAFRDTQLVIGSLGLLALGFSLRLSPPPRLPDRTLATQLDASVPPGRQMTEVTFRIAYDALREELDRAMSAIDSITGRVAAVPPLVVGLGALSIGDVPLGGMLYAPALVSILVAFTGALLAAAFAFLGLITVRLPFGPDPVQVYRHRTASDDATRRMALRSLAEVTTRALETSSRRAWFFNLALMSGTVSIMSVFVLRLLGGGGE